MNNTDANRFRYSVAYTLSFIALLWFIKTVEWALSFDFGVWGIHPRTLTGTLGIITAPLIHGDFTHLLSNSFPLILLGIGVLYFYKDIAIPVFLWIYLATGVFVWVLARDAYHIGASGVVYGLVAFLFFSGLFRRDPRSIAIAFAVILLYGGMFYGVIPTDPNISWESHLLGSIVGVCMSFYYKDTPLSVDQPTFQLEEEEEDAETSAPSSSWTTTHDNARITFTYRYTEKKDSKN